MSRNKTHTLLALLVLGIGLVVAAVVGFFAYISVSSAPIHADAQNVPSVSRAEPSAKWRGAVSQARQLARAGLAEQNLPGLSVAVGVNGEIVWAEGFGWADIEQQTRVTPETRFRIGSTSTVLTSAAVGLLLEKNKLRLEDEVQTYVPEYPRQQWPVTLRHLMGHVAGVRNDAGDEEDVFGRCDRTVDGLQRFADRPVLFEPGTKFRYSSYGWILVSAAVEAAAAEPLLSFMRKQILEPLRMDGTTLDGAPEASRNLASSYFPRFAADPRYGPQSPDALDFSCFAGATGFLSTPSDLVRFGMAVEEGKLLQPATVKLLQTSLRLPSGEETGYGLGWDLETVTLAGEERRVVSHSGEVRGGMVASFLTFPDRGLVVSVTSNTSFADTASLALGIAEAFAAR